MEERNGVVTAQGNPVTLLGPELKKGDDAPDIELMDNDLNPFKLSNYKGKVVYSKNGAATLELKKVSDSDQGGQFNIICPGYSQNIPANLPFPALEEDRTLKFIFKDGETTNLDVPGSGVTHYSYTLKMKCK